MKKFLFIIFMVSFSSSFAQTMTNKKVESPPTFVSLNVYYKPLFIANDRSLFLSANGGFIKFRRVTIGSVVNVSFYKNNTFGVSYSNKFSVGPFIRYYFNQRIFSPFIESSLCYGQSYLKEKDKVLLNRERVEFSLIPGASVKLSSKFHIDAQIKIFSLVNDPAERFQLLPLLGLHYRVSNDKTIDNN